MGTSVMADIHWNGLYHNNTNLNAETEIVPAELSPGVTNRFLEIDTSNAQVNVFFLTDHPAADGSVSCRVRFYTPSEQEEFEGAGWQANIILTNTTPFHDTPASGSYTVEVWKATWQPPNGFTGTVFYAPQVLENGGTDIQSLVRDSSNGGASGEWGVNDGFWQTHAQHVRDGNPSGVDYSFDWTNLLPLDYDGFYFNNPSVSLPENEAVPGLGGTNFFDYSYDPDVPSYVYTLAPQGGLASARTRFWFGGGPGEIIRTAEWFTNVEIGTAAPFHGFTSGSATVDVWRTPFYTPANWGTGGTHTIYYATELTVPKNGVTWMASSLNNAGGAVNVTNDWPTNAQVFTSYAPADGRDWSYTPTAAMVRAESVTRDWAYHNNTALDAQFEVVPDMGATHFVDVNYAATSTTFYVLLDNPSIAIVPGETASVKLRVYNAYNAATDWLTMSWAANASVSAAETFHGLPAAGSKLLDVWKAEWQHPTNAIGPVTNQFNVYYTVQLESLAGSGQYSTDLAYLTSNVGSGDGWGTNNYTVNPQLYGPDYTSHDFTYSHQWRDEGDDDGDGMPNWWEANYLGGKTNGLPGGNNDADALTNLQEWIADTLPNNSNSVYVALITNLTVNGDTVSVQVGPGTSTRREYDLSWKTNLLDASWTPVGLDVPGNYDGSAVTLSVSNSVPNIFYRSAVKLP
jgi:hypothetical protein